MLTIPTAVIAAAKAAAAGWRVPASVSIAQWALESGWGSHEPGNNPFGIKKLEGYPTQQLMTTEYSKARGYYKVAQTFAKFNSLDDAFNAHAKLISTAKVYSSAMFSLPDLNEFVERMASHYATDPMYATKVMSIIHAHNLQEYDK